MQFYPISKWLPRLTIVALYHGVSHSANWFYYFYVSCISLGFGSTLEYPEKSHSVTERVYKLHTANTHKPSSLVPLSSNYTTCAIVPSSMSLMADRGTRYAMSLKELTKETEDIMKCCQLVFKLCDLRYKCPLVWSVLDQSHRQCDGCCSDHSFALDWV